MLYRQANRFVTVSMTANLDSLDLVEGEGVCPSVAEPGVSGRLTTGSHCVLGYVVNSAGLVYHCSHNGSDGAGEPISEPDEGVFRALDVPVDPVVR